MTHGIAHTKRQIVFYSGLLFITTLLPFFINLSGLVYFISALSLNALFGLYVYQLYYSPENQDAVRLFTYSIIDLMLLFTSRLFFIPAPLNRLVNEQPVALLY